MAASHRQRVGTRYERIARAYLERCGLETLVTNYRTRAGELDIVLRHGDVLVIAEVRYRGRSSRLRAAESITPVKQRRIALATEHFRVRYRQYARLPVRFDVVALDAGGASCDAVASIEWLRDAFRIET